MEYLIYDMKLIIFAVFCITLYAIFDKKTNKIQIIDIIMMTILVIISGIRCNFGSDSYNYYIQYNSVCNIYKNFMDVLNSSYQSGFISLCFVIHKLTQFKFAIFWAVALITYPTMIIYMRKKTQKPSIAFAMYILMGFFVISNNILKQNIAMLLLIIAYYNFLKKKKYIGYILITIIASRFHITAIIAGILIFIGTKIAPTYKNLKICIVLGIIISILYNIVIPIILLNVPVLSKYLVYLDIERSLNTIIRGIMNSISYIIMYTILTYILLKNKDKIKEISPKDNFRISTDFIFIYWNYD